MCSFCSVINTSIDSVVNDSSQVFVITMEQMLLVVTYSIRSLFPLFLYVMIN